MTSMSESHRGDLMAGEGINLIGIKTKQVERRLLSGVNEMLKDAIPISQLEGAGT